jgi:hypothetical protein
MREETTALRSSGFAVADGRFRRRVRQHGIAGVRFHSRRERTVVAFV